MACNNEGCGIRGLAHIGVFVKDIEASKQFYTDVLGFDCYFEEGIDTDDGVIKVAFARLGTCAIELVQFPTDQQRKTDGVVAHIALDVSDIECMQACLSEKGVKFETEKPIDLPMIFDNGVRYINLTGPDGEVIELNETL